MDHLKKVYRPIVGSFTIIGEEVLITQLMNLPFGYGKKLMNDATNKTSLLYSSMPGPKETWMINGSKIDWGLAFAPSTSYIHSSCCAQTFGDTLKLSFIFDRAAVEDPDLLLQIVHAKFDQFINGKN